MRTTSDHPVAGVYGRLIAAWNNRHAANFSNLFYDQGICIGFDGSELVGKGEIGKSLSEIFSHHPTARYLTLIRDVTEVADDVVVLRANVGMVPPGKDDIDTTKNAIQCLVARLQDSHWRIILFQNTPARFDGRPEMTEALNRELRSLLTE